MECGVGVDSLVVSLGFTDAANAAAHGDGGGRAEGVGTTGDALPATSAGPDADSLTLHGVLKRKRNSKKTRTCQRLRKIGRRETTGQEDSTICF